VISSPDGGDHRLWCISSAPWVIWVARFFLSITYGRGNESELAHNVRATWERKSAGDCGTRFEEVPTRQGALHSAP
jgi:hypothetical protein